MNFIKTKEKFYTSNIYKDKYGRVCLSIDQGEKLPEPPKGYRWYMDDLIAGNSGPATCIYIAVPIDSNW